MSESVNTAQASTDAGAGQAAAATSTPAPDAPASALSAAGAAEPKADAAAPDQAEAPKPAAVPEKYELKAPEGMELDASALEAATPIFKDLGLTTEQAQKLTDVYASQMAKVAQQQRETWTKQHEGWVSDMKADAEFGGDKFASSLSTMSHVIDKVMGNESAAFKQMLDMTGAGNHPQMARLLYRVGKAIGEDGLVRGSSTGAMTENDLAKSLFPTMKS